MRGFGAFAFVLGFVVLVMANGAIQEILSGVWMLIGAVSFAAGSILEALRQIKVSIDSLPRQPVAAPYPTLPGGMKPAQPQHAGPVQAQGPASMGGIVMRE